MSPSIFGWFQQHVSLYRVTFCFETDRLWWTSGCVPISGERRSSLSSRQRAAAGGEALGLQPLGAAEFGPRAAQLLVAPRADQRLQDSWVCLKTPGGGMVSFVGEGGRVLGY